MCCTVCRQQISLTRSNTCLDEFARLGSSRARPFEQVADVPPISGGSDNFRNARAVSRPSPPLPDSFRTTSELTVMFRVAMAATAKAAPMVQVCKMLGQRRRLKAVLGRPSDLAIAGLFRLENYVDSTSSGSSSPGSSQKWIVMIEGNDIALSPDGPALSPARSPHRPTATPILSTTHLDVSLSANHTRRYHSWNNCQ